MKKKSILGMMLIFLITGCYSNITSPATPLPPSPTAPNVTEIPSPALISTATLSPFPSVTNIPNSASTDTCFEPVNGETPLSDVATGTIVLDKGSFAYRTFLLDLTSGNEYELPSQSKQVTYFGFQVSPDRNLLAYVEGLKNIDGQIDRVILWIINARAEVLEKITFNLPALYSLRWLDNQSMLFQISQTSRDGTVVFFNPFTREQRYVSNELPDFYVWSELVPGQNSAIEYAPNLEWGIYLGRVQNGKLGFKIRDFVIGQTVWEKADTFGEYQDPEWSPNGDEVAVVSSGRLYLVNRKGQASPVLDENQGNQVSKPSWSPDGRYLAFWNFSDLIIFDRKIEQLINPCVRDEYPDYALWSSNSKQLVVSAYLDEGGTLIDIQKQKTYKLETIPDTIYPQGWMNSIP